MGDRKLSFTYKLYDKLSGALIGTEVTNESSGITYSLYSTPQVIGGKKYSIGIETSIGDTYSSDGDFPDGIYVDITEDMQINTPIITHSNNSTNNGGSVQINVTTPSAYYTYELYKKNIQNVYEVLPSYIQNQITANTYTFTGLIGGGDYYVKVKDSRYYDDKRTWGTSQKEKSTSPFRINDNYNIQYTDIKTPPTDPSNASYSITITYGYPPFTVKLNKVGGGEAERDESISSVGGTAIFNGLSSDSTYNVSLKDNRNYKDEQVHQIRFYSTNIGSVVGGVRPTSLINDNAKVTVYGNPYGEPPLVYRLYIDGQVTELENHQTNDKYEIIIFDNLIGGETYNVFFEDSRGVDFYFNQSVVIKNVPVSIYKKILTHPTSSNNDDGTIQIFVDGGLPISGGYNYSIKNLTTLVTNSGNFTGTTYTFTSLTPANYEITITDGYLEFYTATYTINEYGMVYIDQTNIGLVKVRPETQYSEDGRIDVKIINLPNGILDDEFYYELYDINDVNTILDNISHTIPESNSDTTYAAFTGLTHGVYALKLKTSKTLFYDTVKGIDYYEVVLNKNTTTLEYEIINEVYFEDDLTNILVDSNKYASDFISGFTFNINNQQDGSVFTDLEKPISSNYTITYNEKINKTLLRQVDTYIGVNSDTLSFEHEYNYKITNVKINYYKNDNIEYYYNLTDSDVINISDNGNINVVDVILSTPITLRSHYNIYELELDIISSQLSLVEYIDFNTLYYDLNMEIELKDGVMIFNELTKFNFYNINLNFTYSLDDGALDPVNYNQDLTIDDFDDIDYTYIDPYKVSITLRKKIINSVYQIIYEELSVTLNKESVTNRILKISNDNFINNIIYLTSTTNKVIEPITYNFTYNEDIESIDNPVNITITPLSHKMLFNYGNDNINVYYDKGKSSPLAIDGSLGISVLGGVPPYSITLKDVSENIISYNNNVSYLYDINNLNGGINYYLLVSDDKGKEYINTPFIIGYYNYLYFNYVVINPLNKKNNNGSIILTPPATTLHTYVLKYNDNIIKKVKNETSYIFYNLTGGLSYGIVIYNSAYGYYNTNINIPKYKKLEVVITPINPTNVSNNNGQIKIQLVDLDNTNGFVFSIWEVGTSTPITNYNNYNFDNGFYETVSYLLGGETYTIYLKDSTGVEYTEDVYMDVYYSTDIDVDVNVIYPDNGELNNNGRIVVNITTSNTLPYTITLQRNGSTEDPQIIVTSNRIETFYHLGGGSQYINSYITYSLTISDSSLEVKTYTNSSITMYSVRMFNYSIIQKMRFNQTSLINLRNYGYNVEYGYDGDWDVKRSVQTGTYYTTLGYDYIEVTQIDKFTDYTGGGVIYSISLSDFSVYYSRPLIPAVLLILDETSPLGFTEIPSDIMVTLHNEDINVDIVDDLTATHLNIQYINSHNIPPIITLNSISLTGLGEATLEYGYTELYGQEATFKGACYSLYPEPNVLDFGSTAVYTDINATEITVSGLLYGSLYYFRLFIIVNGTTYYSNEDDLHIIDPF